jgi:hypothetical protein
MKANKTTNFELRMSDSCAGVARRHNGFYFVRMEGSGNGVVNNTVYWYIWDQLEVEAQRQVDLSQTEWIGSKFMEMLEAKQ